jgi:hypothetical protein
MLETPWFPTAFWTGKMPPGAVTVAIADTPPIVLQQQPDREALTTWGRSMVLEWIAHGELRALDMAQCAGMGAVASQRHGTMS